MHIRFLLAALLFPPASLAQGIELEKRPFNENVSDYSKVSGDIIMGVMLAGDARAGDAPSTRDPSIVTGVVEGWRASAEPTPVCVRLVSKDGRYEAENTYVVEPNYDRDYAPFPYEGSEAAVLAERAAVVLVKEGQCGNRSETVIPTLWKAEPGLQPTTLSIYVNSAGNPVSVALGRGDAFFEPCADVTETSGLKYTTRCDVPLAALPRDDSARLTFFVARSNTEEVFTLEVLPLYIRG